MPLKMVLATYKGECMKCHEQDRWLYHYKTELICDDCLREIENDEAEPSIHNFDSLYW